MSIMSRINAAQSTTVNTTRNDGYTNDSPVFTFQAEIERSFAPNYTALRSVLAMARNQPGMTLSDLHAAYIIATAQ